MPGMKRAYVAVAAVLTVAGCSEDKKADGAAAGGGEVAAASGADAVVDAWKAAGLTVSAFDPVDGAAYGDGECRGGTVNGVDAVLCQYATADLATAAQPKGLAAVGETTGSSLAQATLLLVVADRRKADPDGRTINQVTKIFRGR
jgi:hypothetical protein